MSDTLTLLALGFQAATTPPNILAAFLGCILGTLVGVLPGIGPATTVALLIPVAFGLNPSSALIMMTAVYLGAKYGGALTSVLLRVPGEASSMMTAIDGYEMARQGRAAQALAVAAVGGFLGGSLSVVGLTVFAMPVASAALLLGSTELCSLLVSALLFIAVLLGKDLLKSAAGVMVGLAIGVIGVDLQTGVPRLTFGFENLQDGIESVVVLIGVYGVGEVFWFLSHNKGKAQERLALRGRLWLSRDDWRRCWPAILRSSVIGFIAGVLPGSGSSLGSVMAYSTEQRISREPERFGKGAIEAVACSETADNAATGGALIPMLTLGIPGSGTTAVLLVALMMYGISPGPRLLVENPQVIWSVIASLYVSNVILLVLNLPLIPVFVRVLDMPVSFLMPLILVFAAVGAYAAANSFTDLMLVFLFGVVGYLFRLAGISQVGLIIGIILGPRTEESLRQAILLSHGDWTVFVTRPISAAFLAAGIGLVLWDLSSGIRKRTSGRSSVEPGTDSTLTRP